MIMEFEGTRPTIAADAFVAPNATVIGRVKILAGASIWFGAVVRGDIAEIEVGAGTNIQDLTMVHADQGIPTRIGQNVTVGHRAILHGCTIEDECIVGMGAIVQNRVRVGEHSIIGSGAVVREGFEVPPNSLVLGVPAVVKRTLTPEEVAGIRKLAAGYAARAKGYRESTKC